MLQRSIGREPRSGGSLQFRSRGSSGVSYQNELSQFVFPGLIQGRKGKGSVSGPILSGGLEDIVNLGSIRGIRTSGEKERGPAVIRSVNAENLVNPSRRSAVVVSEPGEYVKPKSNFNSSGYERQEVVLDSIGVLGEVSGREAVPENSPQGKPSEQREGITQNVVNTQTREDGFVVIKLGEKRKKLKPIKKKDIEANLVLGMDVQVDEALEVAKCTLVGRAKGKKHSSQFIKIWGEQKWQTDLVKNFKVSVLAKGWFMVRFGNKEVADWVMERNWAFDNFPVLFKRWSPMFDALHERTDVFPVWVRAPGLPSFL